jgi:hypothetical protein
VLFCCGGSECRLSVPRRRPLPTPKCGQRVQISNTFSVPYPEPLLPSGFETGIITLAFRPQRIEPPETQTAAVNGKPVICGNGLVFGTAPVPFAILVHGKSRFADRVARGEILSTPCAAPFERDDGFSVIDVPHCIVDAPRVITLVGKKRTFLQGKNPAGVWKFKIKGTKEFVVEYGNIPGREQRHALNDFLSVDSGQPLSV